MPGAPRLSLERKLPLLISVFLVALAVGLTAAGYHEVRQASEMRGIERMRRITGQLAQLSSATTEQRFAALRRVAADSAVVASLASPDDDPRSRNAALAALRALAITATDSDMVAEIRSSSEPRRIATQPEVPDANEPVNALIAVLAKGKAAMGNLYTHGDSVFLWVGAPVSRDGRVLGYVVQRRRVASNPRTQEQIRELAGGDSLSIFFASDSGTTWASLVGTPTPQPRLDPNTSDSSTVVYYTRPPSKQRFVGVFARVPNTPIRLFADRPYASLLERPTAFLRRSISAASGLLVVAIIAAWILSRRITRPIRDLTVAADALSAGDYSHRAPVGRDDETGRLAAAFNLMAEQVQRSHDDLERQIAESRSLAARLNEANRAKSDFLATMSHELRTPLNAIGGYVELIDLGVRGPVNEDQRRDLDRVRHNQRHLLTLIGNILDFARLDAQKLPFDMTDVPVDRVVDDVLTSVAPLLDAKALRRECHGCEATVLAHADRARVEQILLNLISNAVRFTPAGGLVTVTVGQANGHVEISVADTGIGIPPDKLAAIFEPFVQVDSGLTRTVGGTGLGLTISRSLARAMGGDLTGESDGTNGARFTVTLPVARTAATGAAVGGANGKVAVGAGAA